MSTYDAEPHLVARLKWPGDQHTWVQVFPDGALYFEEDVNIIGRMEPEDVGPFFENLGRFAQAYEEALAELRDLEK